MISDLKYLLPTKVEPLWQEDNKPAFLTRTNTQYWHAPMSTLKDLTKKHLVLHRMQFPSSTLRRVIKYSKKGFYACPGALVTIAQQVHENIDKEDGEYVYVD